MLMPCTPRDCGVVGPLRTATSIVPHSTTSNSMSMPTALKFCCMNSFIGIANTNTTNLAVVAPGIAEALLATGLGLFAAIPSVIFYNFFQTKISTFGARSEGFVAELMNAISRNLDKGA